MKERSILFSGTMVRSILEGSKTQTRRIVKPQPVHVDGGYFYPQRSPFEVAWAAEHSAAASLEGFKVEAATEWLIQNGKCPYGKPGDRLWVRETWCGHISKPKILAVVNDTPPEQEVFGATHRFKAYKADWGSKMPPGYYKWKPSIHMPHWASRILLEITEIRVERIQDISEKDAKAEGIESYIDSLSAWQQCQGVLREDYLIRQFEDLWNSINGPDAWEKNHWVWVILFKRIEP